MISTQTPASVSGKTRRRGVAILIALAVLTLLSFLTFSLLTMSMKEKVSSHLEHEERRARFAADTVVNLALGQLREATSRTDGTGTPAPWTSQPGAVRVHRMDGELQWLYKLYSAEEMRVTDSSGIAGDVPRDWLDHPEQFVDLNAPVIHDATPGEKRTLYFPIVDPRAKSSSATKSVEGFEYTGNSAPGGTVGPGGDEDTQRVPMPVRWIYQLEDGTMGTVDAMGMFRGFHGETATRENPMVSRVAFWTDDESCKININTASEGAYWDTPRADTAQERQFAINQPTSGEYHRQPGHPAGVSLSTVLLPGRRFQSGGVESENPAMQAMSLTDVQDLWSLGRLDCGLHPDGTSIGGTVSPSIDFDRTQLPPIVERPRYTSVEEMLWNSAAARGQSEREAQPFFQRHPEAAARLTRSEFFLTTESAAPETTLFGTPRIALWPVHGSTDLQAPAHAPPVERATGYDYQVSLAATLGGRKYFVQRLRATDGLWELEKTNYGENRELLDYLTRLTDRPVPGWQRPLLGYGTFAEKYGPDREGILVEMLDYIRAANFSDGLLKKENQFPIACPGNPEEGFGQVAPLSTEDKVRGFGRMLTVSEVALLFVCRAEVNAEGKIEGEPSGPNRASLKNPGDREIEAALLVEGFVPSQGWADYRPYVSFSLTGGAPHAEPDPVSPWPKMKLNDVDFIPVQSKPTSQSSPETPRGWSASGGPAGVRALTERVIAFRPVVVPGANKAGARLTFSGSTNQEGLQLKLSVYDDPGSAASGRAGQGDLQQVIPLEIPPIGGLVPSELPIPSLPRDGTAVTIEKRMRAARLEKPLLSAGDVVQSLVPAHGDYRVLAPKYRAEAPADSSKGNAGHAVFVSHPLWGKSRFAHSLKEPLPAAREQVLGLKPTDTDPDNPNALGYFKDLTLAPAFAPDSPVRVFEPGQSVWAGTTQGLEQVAVAGVTDWTRLDGMSRGPARPDITGDFDNGLANAPDGPYTNRPDDGDLGPLAKGEVPYFSSARAGVMTVPPVSADVFSPQRLFSSAVTFGSLPTGVASQVPWQTLLFRPQPGHFGAKSPPDHLLLDLFWTPVLAPQPLSNHLETEGKINVNHPLVPFGYIQRETALLAAIKAEALMAIPDEAARTYKSGEKQGDQFRHFIDGKATLKEWKNTVFNKGRVFLTPGEICEHPLIPEGSQAASAADMESYWKNHRLTGDNTRENPYSRLYPRLTTRGNVFRVHFIAESIQKASIVEPNKFDIREDSVTARVRGTCLLRRQLQTDSPNFPDYAAASSGQRPLDSFYRWRISQWREVR